MITLAFMPPQAMLLGLFLLALGGFILYRKLMRTGKARDMFDMEERSKTTSDILGDISEDEQKLLDRGNTLLSEKRQLNKELNKIKNHNSNE